MQLAIVQARHMLDASGLPLLHYENGVPGDVAGHDLRRRRSEVAPAPRHRNACPPMRCRPPPLDADVPSRLAVPAPAEGDDGAPLPWHTSSVMIASTAEDLYQLVQQLPAAERLRLVEKIARDLSTAASPAPPARAPFDWSQLAGAAPGLLGGEDAQAWVHQSRHESDTAHEHPTGRKP